MQISACESLQNLLSIWTARLTNKGVFCWTEHRRKERPPPWTTTKLDALFSAKMNGTYQVGMYYVYGIWDEDTQFTNSCMNTVCTYLLLLNCMLSAFLAYEKMRALLLHF